MGTFILHKIFNKLWLFNFTRNVRILFQNIKKSSQILESATAKATLNTWNRGKIIEITPRKIASDARNKSKIAKFANITPSNMVYP